MFSRYTPAAKRIIFFAHIEALHRDEQWIRPVDLLVGLTWEAGSGPLVQLKEHAVSLRAKFGISHLPSTSFPYRREGALPLDASAKQMLLAAATEADRDGQYWIDSDHIVRGLLSSRNEVADALLEEGIDFESARHASITIRHDSPPPPAPFWGRVRLAATRRRYLLVPLLLLAFAVVLFVVLKLRGPVQ